jgi:hypothetical protein
MLSLHYSFRGKISDTPSIGVEFPALVSDTMAIRHVPWQDLNDLLLLRGLVRAKTSGSGKTNEPLSSSQGRNLEIFPGSKFTPVNQERITGVMDFVHRPEF